MNNKGLIMLTFGFIFLLFLASLAPAQEGDSIGDIDKAYDCLKNQTAGKNLSLKEAIFTSLAIGGQDAFADIEAFKDSNSCWPKGACTLKDTSQALLAYKRVGKDTTAIKNWVLSKNISATELKWLLEIDTGGAASTCTIKYGQTPTTAVTITIGEDAKIQGNPVPCFSIDQNGYMLSVNSNCLRNEFTISCEGSFVTSILYKKVTGDTLFILPETHSATDGYTTEKISGECLKAGTTCDYEGTLWAALALLESGEDISRFLPYLLALADDNTKYFPSAILYALTNGEDQYGLIIQQQKEEKFWQIIGSKEGRYYDTSLAMLGLGEGVEVEATKSYLLGIQTNDGCWNNNNVRDTAFILYSGWSRNVASVGTIGSEPCEPTFSCENLFECTNAEGDTMDLECPNIGQVCCTVEIAEETCEQKGGLICPSGTQCDGRLESSAEGSSCCVDGSCITVEVEDTCTPSGGECKTFCEDNEEISYYEACPFSGESCCIQRKGGIAWIVILVLLIIVLALGIIFRAKVRIWWYKVLEKLKKKPKVQPPAKPTQLRYPRRMIQPRPLTPPPISARPVKPSIKDKEMEEALRRLRKMAGRK